MRIITYEILGKIGFRFLINDGTVKIKKIEWSAITTPQFFTKVCRLNKKLI